ncbi:MAG: hypothetical protein Q8Q24_00270 [bacterium]|nr:hypothetical protein [bacterium]
MSQLGAVKDSGPVVFSHLPGLHQCAIKEESLEWYHWVFAGLGILLMFAGVFLYWMAQQSLNTTGEDLLLYTNLSFLVGVIGMIVFERSMRLLERLAEFLNL